MAAREDRGRRYSVAEWRALLERSAVKYEYHDGWLVAMAGGTADHSTIAGNAYLLCRAALEGTPCRVYNSDMAVRVSQAEYRFPAVTISYDERDRGRVREILAPRVVIKVLSDSTEQEDRTTNSRCAAPVRACRTMCCW